MKKGKPVMIRAMEHITKNVPLMKQRRYMYYNVHEYTISAIELHYIITEDR